MRDYSKYVVCDTETNSFNDTPILPWEIAVLTSTGTNGVWQRLLIHISDYPLGIVTREVSAINGFSQRWMEEARALRMPFVQAAEYLSRVFEGKMIVGSAPDYDRDALRNMGVTGFSHRMRDVATLAMGYTGFDYGGLEDTAEALGVTWPQDAPRHTAMGDAIVTRDILVHVMERSGD